MNVGNVMTRHPAVVALDTPARVAAELMRSQGIRHLPVVAGGRLVGILTEHDVFTGLTKGSGVESDAEFFLW